MSKKNANTKKDVKSSKTVKESKSQVVVSTVKIVRVITRDNEVLVLQSGGEGIIDSNGEDVSLEKAILALPDGTECVLHRQDARLLAQAILDNFKEEDDA